MVRLESFIGFVWNDLLSKSVQNILSLWKKCVNQRSQEIALFTDSFGANIKNLGNKLLPFQNSC